MHVWGPADSQVVTAAGKQPIDPFADPFRDEEEVKPADQDARFAQNDESVEDLLRDLDDIDADSTEDVAEDEDLKVEDLLNDNVDDSDSLDDLDDILDDLETLDDELTDDTAPVDSNELDSNGSDELPTRGQTPADDLLPAVPHELPAPEDDMSAIEDLNDDLPFDADPDNDAHPEDDEGDDYSFDDDDEMSFDDDEDEDEGFGFDDDEDEPTGPRTYNERDCAKAEQNCLDSWELIRSHDITRISLDVTPSFNPNEDDAEELQKDRIKRLAKSEFRTWTDRGGNIVANGQFQDFRNGRVIISSDTGATVPILFSRLSDDDACFVAAWWGMPAECRLSDKPFAGRNFIPLTMTWKASGLCHKPLYFEQVQAERYGHSFGPIAQPLISSAHFFGHALMLPYQIGMSPPGECEYALGYYRPGSCAPYLFPPFPLSARAALLQSGTVVGLVYAIP